MVGYYGWKYGWWLILWLDYIYYFIYWKIFDDTWLIHRCWYYGCHYCLTMVYELTMVDTMVDISKWETMAILETNIMVTMNRTDKYWLPLMVYKVYLSLLYQWFWFSQCFLIALGQSCRQRPLAKTTQKPLWQVIGRTSARCFSSLTSGVPTSLSFCENRIS